MGGARNNCIWSVCRLMAGNRRVQRKTGCDPGGRRLRLMEDCAVTYDANLARTVGGACSAYSERYNPLTKPYWLTRGGNRIERRRT